ncbi:BREX-1 system adenine-specific DNA-methyltransferase PglX [Clostridium sp. Cult1]|uniref:BREX-1 system adenine-specific DNA-methyltransferase PglX n=1 Tax=Clostridium sp. Cult1 TaxID=2079002 RepID=UPI001F00109C|nr:BREX-1 system adenine-specific DNA-methyltransferase PglX [Clostridium sp. Cult1]MCF6462921.1 restriction endonuclease [Clostridium sp. Cult1]
MDKTALKNFAMYSRQKLIKDIETKANFIGITKEGIKDPLPESTEDMFIFNIGEIEPYRIHGEDVKKYKKLVKELKKREDESGYKTAYKTLIEEVAYTWFNRIIAIRFMEVNNYMPDKMRILSSGKEGVREPEFVTYYRDTDIGITEEEFEKLDELKLDGSAEAMDDLFQFMFIKQCNALNKNLPELFEKTDDYAELLLNISYNDPEGVVYKLIEDIGEEPFDIEETGQIEIIGWLYQYYNTELKAEIDAAVKKNKKVDKNTLPAKTQLFTPEWIVQYMVQNSLGRLWIERKIAIGTDKTEEELAKEYGWEYYLPEAEQVEEVKVDLKNIREDRKYLKVEDITFIDPSMGSGHILVYAFEMFMQFHLEEGYTEREAAESIIENNLYGLDIDKRAYQLAYFSLMMKGRQYSRRILNKEIENNLYYFIDSKDINVKQIDFLGGNIEDEKYREALKKDILEIVELFKDGRELGSIIKIDKEYNYDELIKFASALNLHGQVPMEADKIETTQEDIIYILELTRTLSDRYSIVLANPPYLGSDNMSKILKKYVERNYKDSWYDLYSVFMEKCFIITSRFGYNSMITQHNFMFAYSYVKFRYNVVNYSNILSMLHLGPGTFEEISGEVVQSIAFVVGKFNIDYITTILRLVEVKNKEEKFHFRHKHNNILYLYDMKRILELPENIFVYSLTEKQIKLYKEHNSIEESFIPKAGIVTGKDIYFIRYWYEVNNDFIEYKPYDINHKYVLYSKGGSFKKWYGNINYVIKLSDLWDDNKVGKSVRRGDKNYYFAKGVGWSQTGSNKQKNYSMLKNCVCGTGTPMIYNANIEELHYVLGFLNSNISGKFLSVLNPTLNTYISDIYNLPYVVDNVKYKLVIKLVKENIEISKTDLDSFETSWNFKTHPFLYFKIDNKHLTIEDAYYKWKDFTHSEFAKLKSNEELLNEIFIEIYGLEDELTPEVSDKDITIAKIFDDKKDIYEDIKGNQYILTKEDVVKSFISYGVGCIFGRYSLDEKGLVYAGGEFDISRYNKFKPVEDNIVVITDEEYFEDDLANRFVEFVRISFGKENLEENLKFIADSLKGIGTPKEKIRKYFLNDFYDNHCSQYSMPREGKRPIYWLYDSGKENGFKALIYMHRYDEDTTGRVRIDYLHKLQRIYENRIDFLRDDIANNSNANEVAKSEKKLEKIMKQLKECKDYDKKIGHIALSRIAIDLDDGVKVNYEKVQTDNDGEKYQILAKI